MEAKLSFNFKTNQEILKIISFFGGFRGKWSQIDGKESRYLNELRQIATIERVSPVVSISFFIIPSLI